MAAQEDSDTRTDSEIQEDTMKVLIDVLGGDKDGNFAKTIEVNKIKDPSLIMVITDEEIEALKINKNVNVQ